MTDTVTEPTTADIRTWAQESGLEVGSRGTLSASVKQAYADAHSR